MRRYPQIQQPIRNQPAHLQEAAGHVVSKHGQTGSTVPVDVEGVDRHDDRLRPSVIRHQDTDPAVAEAEWIVHHPVGWHSVAEVRGQDHCQGSGSGVLGSPGPLLLVQVNLTLETDGFWSDTDHHCVKGHFSVILFNPGAEGRDQSEGRVSVDLSEVGVHTRS